MMTALIVQQGLFWICASILIGSAAMAVFSRHSVHCALWLVLAFFSAAVLWVSLQAEFLGLLLILVYVGAVMTLFLFVIMTLPLSQSSLIANWRHRLPAIVVILWLCLMIDVFYRQAYKIPKHHVQPAVSVPEMSNTQFLGRQLYTQYVYPFELAGILLLVAIVASLSLNPTRRPSSKFIAKSVQQRTRAKDRVKLVRIEGVKKP